MMQITVYSSPTCPHCRALKDYLDKKGVAYTDHNVVDDAQAREEMFKLTGKMAVPVVVVDGEVIMGFDRAKLEKLFG